MYDDTDDRLTELESRLEDLKEELFLCKQDEEKHRVENIALKNFIQNLYESCESIEERDDTEKLALNVVLDNLKTNIRRFAKDHNIRL